MNKPVAYYLRLIEEHYGGQRSKRSKVLYINHIKEGLLILDYLGASDLVRAAWCIHPILQIPDTLKEVDVTEWDADVVLHGMEYRNKANAYSTRNMDRHSCLPVLVLDSTKLMLIADKVQNYKDFLKYHQKDGCERSWLLNAYFKNWLSHLGLGIAGYNVFVEVIK